MDNTIKDRLDELRRKYGSLTKAKNSLLKEKLSILELADDQLVAGAKKTEKSLFTKVMAIIRSFTTQGGKIVRDDATESVLNRINKRLNKVVGDSTIRSKTGQYLRNFDRIETLSKQILEIDNNSIDAFRKLNVSAEKRRAIEEITDQLVTDESLKRLIRNPIKKILFRHATSGVSIKDAEAELRSFINGEGDKLGNLSGQVSRITKDAINQYSGHIKQQAAIEFDMPHFQIVGSLIRGSRQNCIDMMNGTGPFANFISPGGFYRVSDIKKILPLIRNKSGFNPATNESNYLILRNGFNCRHSFEVGYDFDDRLVFDEEGNRIDSN